MTALTTLTQIAREAGTEGQWHCTESVVAGRLYELRILLHREAAADGAGVSFTEIGLIFHDALGETCPLSLAGEALAISHLSPLEVETLPVEPTTDALRAAGTASRFVIPPPDAVEMRLTVAAPDVAVDFVQVAPMAVAWSVDGAALRKHLDQASRLRLDLLLRHLPAACPQAMQNRIRTIPAEQIASIQMQFAAIADWAPALERLVDAASGDEEIAEFDERIARRAARRVTDAPRIAFVGSARTYARLRCLADVVLLRETHWRAQIDLLALDRIVIETAAETPVGDWSGAFASLSGRLSAVAGDLCAHAAARGLPLCLLVTAEPSEMPIWKGLAEKANSVVIEGRRDAWPDSGPNAAPSGARFVRPATEPLANPALRRVEHEGSILVPMASDVFQFPEFADLIRSVASDATLLTEFHYRFAPKALADRIAPAACRMAPISSRGHAVRLLQASTLVLLNGRSLRSDAQMVEIVLDAIAAGAIPVIHGPCRVNHPIMDLLDRVWGASDLLELQRLMRVPWLRERRWRTLLREVCRHHVWTADERAAVLGSDPFPAGWDTPLISAVMVSKRPHLLEGCLEAFRQQTTPARELIVVLNTDKPPAALPTLCDNERLFVVPESWSIGRCLNMAIGEAHGEIWAKFDDDDCYARTYLEELAYYYRATEGDAIGRQAAHFYFEGEDQTLTRDYVVPRCFRPVAQRPIFSHVSGATLSARLDGTVPRFSNSLRNAADSAWNVAVLNAGHRFLCYDSTSMIVYRNADEAQHTWRMSGSLIDFKRFEAYCSGNIHDRLDAPSPALRD